MTLLALADLIPPPPGCVLLATAIAGSWLLVYGVARAVLFLASLG